MSRVVGTIALSVLTVLLGCEAGDADTEFNPGSNQSSGTGGAGNPSTGGSGGGGSGGVGEQGTGGGGGQVLPADDRVFMPGTDPNRNAVRPGGICRRMAEIQCAGEAFCCIEPGRTMQACQTTMETGCKTELGLDELAADPLTAFDAARALTAFQKFEDLASTCDPTIAKWASLDSGMRGILRGTRDGSCPLGSAIDVDWTSIAQSTPTAEEEAAARVALLSCKIDSNLACKPSLSRCTERGGVGISCYSDLNCNETFYCDNPEANLTGADCAARKAAGSNCLYLHECVSRICSFGKCAADDIQGAYCLDK